MIIYAVEYTTGYDYNENLGYFLDKQKANEKAKEINRQNPGLDAFVTEIEVN